MGRFSLNAQRIGCPLHSGRVPRIPVGIIILTLIYYVCRSSTQTARGKVTAVPVPKHILKEPKPSAPEMWSNNLWRKPQDAIRRGKRRCSYCKKKHTLSAMEKRCFMWTREAA